MYSTVLVFQSKLKRKGNDKKAAAAIPFLKTNENLVFHFIQFFSSEKGI